jgi:hypothetical protein
MHNYTLIRAAFPARPAGFGPRLTFRTVERLFGKGSLFPTGSAWYSW